MPPLKSYLSIPGFCDKAVEEYCAWHQSKFEDLVHKDKYQNAYNVMKENATTLQLIFWDPDPNPNSLIMGGVKRGAASYIATEIEEWFQQCKQVSNKW